MRLRTLILLAGIILPAPAMAQEHTKTINYSLPAGKTFAIRSLCLEYDMFLEAYLPNNRTNLLGYTDGYCVNGRTGFTFTVPTGAAMQFVQVLVGWDYPPNPDLKIRIDPDCRGDAATTCALNAISDPLTNNLMASASGRFTWPGDEDWYRLDGLDVFRITTARDTCVAVGKVIRIADVNPPYLVVSGGPAGCTYTVTATEHPVD